MIDIGEEICGEYLRNILHCDFVVYNVRTKDTQGEIDVIGVKQDEKRVYVCEVASHIRGLQYTKNNQPDNYSKFIQKFNKNINYAKKYFASYPNIIPMIWSPVVRISKEGSKHSAHNDLLKVQGNINDNFNLNLELVINEKYFDALSELRAFAGKKSFEMQSNVMRLLQIEEYLNRHVINIKKRKAA